MRSFVSTLFVLGTAVLLLDACRKCDLPNPVGNAFEISTLTADGEHLAFAYNKKGDPVSIIRDRPGTGAPNFFFRYDTKGRLSAYYGTYAATGTGAFETWHVYVYNSKDQIISDTAYWFGQVSPDYKPIPEDGHPLQALTISNYAYDQYGRLITDETQSLGAGYQPWYKRTYQYNPQGNLYKIAEQNVLSGDTTYTFTFDNKVNAHRTSWVWQFIDKDYSLNGQLPVTAYNKQGLPVKLDAIHDYNSFLHVIYQHLDIAYKQK